MFDVNWEQVWGVVITTIIVGIVRCMYSFWKEQREKYEQEQRTKNNIIQALMKNNEELIDWRKDMEQRHIQLEQELQSINQYLQKVSHSDLILMRDRILQSCRYFISQGYVTITARENITEMFHCYTDIGGNGTCKMMYEQMLELPIKEVVPTEPALQKNVSEEVIPSGTKPVKRKKKSPEMAKQS